MIKFSNKPIVKKIVKKSIFPLLSFTFFAGTVFFWSNQNYGLALEYNGEKIATVPTGDVYEKASRMVRDQLASSAKSKVENKSSQIKVILVNSDECCSSPSDVKNKIIESSQDAFVDACGVYVDNKLIGVGESEEKLKKMFDECLDEQKKLNPDTIVELSDKIEFKKGFFAPDDVKSAEQLKKYFFSEIEKEFKYNVVEGDTVSAVAEKFGISEDTIRESNDIAGDDLAPEDVLIIRVKDSILNFRFFKLVEEEKEIPFTTITNENSDKYASWSNVVQEGENGKEVFKYKVEYKNGKEVSKIELSHELVADAKEKIVEVGTKQAPEGFIWPVPYTKNITSPFGPRWGTMHQGIDIAAAGVAGTDIVAAEDGTVEKASYGSKGYGNHIIIKHDGKYSTLYGHCQTLCVSAGNKVKKGDVIAKVGSTGDSTGPHLHFEVRVNGKAENPQNYVK